VIDAARYGSVVRGNTVFRNGGSGIEVNEPEVEVPVVNNLGFGNVGWGLTVSPGAPVTLACNDWFGNGGEVNGVGVGASDVRVDPLFCNVDSADVRLDSASPLADAAGCGQIGALGVGCGKTATVLQMVAVVPQGRGVAVRWRFGSIAPALTWLERATGQAGPWRPVSGQPEADGETYTQVDEDAEPGISYWYRVGWQEGAGQEVGYSTPVRYAIERLSPESRVFPNPTFGPATIEWTLEATTDMDVRIYDLAGREVAAPARGAFGPGKYSTRWDGLRSDGEPAPAGWYVVRLRGGTLSAAHRLLLLR
jgi:hypothetical protein